MGQVINTLNNDKTFKVLVIGCQGSGKTTTCSLLQPQQGLYEEQNFSNFQYPITKKATLDVWDLDGKLPHLWNHHFNGVNGIVYLLDQKKVDTDDGYMEKSIKELLNILSSLFEVPMAIIINQHHDHKRVLKLDKFILDKEVFSVPDVKKENYDVFELDVKQLKLIKKNQVNTSKQIGLESITSCFQWLLVSMSTKKTNSN